VRSPESTDAQKETMVAPGKRHGNKGPRQQTATISEEKEAKQDGIGGCKSGQRSPLGRRGTRKKALYEIVSMKIAQQIAEIFKKTRGLEVAKGTARYTVQMQKVKDWTLWWGRPPPKWKKKLQIQEEPDNVRAPATP
jgi:hypothetical protein